MQTNITKWGNSLALRLPKHMAVDARLREGTPVNVELNGDALIVRPARPKYRLADLLAQSPDRNPDDERGDREIDWGTAEGEEEW